jgi:hypothetical protein
VAAQVIQSQAGAPALDRFAAGLAAAHNGSPAHTVMHGILTDLWWRVGAPAALASLSGAFRAA